jgi:hypothetical protein
MMGEIIMSLSRFLASVFIVAASHSAVAAPEAIICPQKHQEGARTAHLEDIDIFEGPPENLASQMPDLETSEWDLSQNQKTAKQRGEPFYLVCRYKGIKSTVVMKIPYSVKYCKIQGVKNGMVAACR